MTGAFQPISTLTGAAITVPLRTYLLPLGTAAILRNDLLPAILPDSFALGFSRYLHATNIFIA